MKSKFIQKTFLSLLALLAFPWHLSAKALLSPNEVAHLLAGSTQVQNPSAHFIKIVNSKEWQSRLGTSLAYRFNPPSTATDSLRAAKVDRDNLQLFASQKLSAAYTHTKKVFYPFAGGDVFYPFVFFPYATDVVMAAREPMSRLLTIEKESDLSKLYGQMNSLDIAFQSFFHYGYFITAEMENQLNTLGTSSVISVSLAAQGFEISSIRYFRFGSDGKVTYLDPNKEDTDKSRAVEINFFKNDPQKTPGKIVYFKQDLANGYVDNSFESYVRSFGAQASYFKAPSYVPQIRSAFTKVNNLALRSRYIVQGDGGLGWDTILASPKVMHVDLFGVYSRPSRRGSADFGVDPQRDLLDSYAVALSRVNDSEAQEAKEVFKNYWGNSVSQYDTKTDESYVEWAGFLPIRYDYAGRLNSWHLKPEKRYQMSNLMYVIQNSVSE